MNKKAQKGTIGFVLMVIAFMFILVLFAIIEPFKEALDDTRGTSSLNCPGTLNHNSTSYAEDNDFEKLVRRPTCFVTGISMLWFIGSFLIATISWVVVNWRKTRIR